MKIEKPTLQNLPPQRKKFDSQANFNYSLCESIDYQQESLLPKGYEQHDKAPTPNFYSLEDVQKLLNSQKEELMSQF